MSKKSLTELESKIEELEDNLELRDEEISNLEAELSRLHRQLNQYPDDEEFLGRLRETLVNAVRDVGPTMLGPLNAIERVVEALEHGVITMVKT